MEKMDYEKAAHDVCLGKMSFEEFAQHTGGRWNFWAGKLLNQWGRLPAWIGQEDLHQELLTEAWKATTRFDAKRSNEPAAYVQFIATKAVSKIVHRARGVEQHRRHGASRYEIACGDFDKFSVTDPSLEPDEEIDRANKYEILRALCSTEEQRIVLLALELSGGSLEAAAAYLYSDCESRFACRLVSETHAVSVINRAVTELVENYGIEEAL